MINFLKNNLIYLLLFLILIYKGVFIDFVANINSLFTDTSNFNEAEINILKEQNKRLENDLLELSNLNTYNNDYKITRLSYRNSFSDTYFYIEGSDYNENSYLVNKDGLVGIIKKLKKDYSECIFITGIDNLSVKINDVFGTIKKYNDEYFIIDDITNYDNININDEVYTATINSNKTPVIVGKVKKIEEHDISKTIYVKSNVDFHNINYLYVVN